MQINNHRLSSIASPILTSKNIKSASGSESDCMYRVGRHGRQTLRRITHIRVRITIKFYQTLWQILRPPAFLRLISQLTKETINTPSASNSTKQKTDETTTEHQPNNDINENRPSEHTTNTKQSANSIAELATSTIKVQANPTRKRDTN